jgi:hypothetical protein
MENKLYEMMGSSMKEGLHIPLNQPDGWKLDKRLETRNGAKAADFPTNTVVEKPSNPSE